MPCILPTVLMTPLAATHIVLPEHPAGVLCVLSSPNFVPTFYPPLSAVAIGSGAGALTQIDEEADWVFAGDVGNTALEAEALIQAVRHYTASRKVRGVGGLFCCLKVSSDGCRFHTFRAEMPVGGTRIELALNAKGRVEQRNLTTRKTIELRFPWEISRCVPAGDDRFDDLDDIERSRLTGTN
jgi:hypothetical protein